MLNVNFVDLLEETEMCPECYTNENGITPLLNPLEVEKSN